jgi:hypothetical protein
VLIFRSWEDSGSRYLVATVDNPTSFEGSSTSDSVSNDDIRDEELSYANNALNYAPWPAHRVSGFASGRYWVVPREWESTRVWFSNKLTPGAHIAFNGSYVTIPQAGGRITGIVDFFDKAVVLCESAIYAIDGEGPNSVGVGAFSDAYLVDGSTGCSNPSSIAQYGLSVCFESKDGIKELTPSMTIKDVGGDVVYYSSSMTITSAVVLPETSEVVFFGTSTGNWALVYNYLFEAWSVWTNHSATGATYDGSVYWFNAAGSIRRQTSAYADPSSTWVQLMVVSGWLSRANVGGYKRILSQQTLGQKIGDCNLNVDFGYDFDPTFSEEQHSVDLSSLASSDWTDHLSGVSKGSSYVGDSMLMKAWPKKTRATAIRARIYDSPTLQSGNTQGVSLSTSSLEVQLIPGAARTNGRDVGYDG